MPCDPGPPGGPSATSTSPDGRASSWQDRASTDERVRSHPTTASSVTGTGDVDRRPPTPPVRWGIIGVGDVTEVKSGPAFQQAQGSELVAVMRRDGVAARDWADRHGVAKAYDDVDALLADDEVDAVYIATPPGSHHDLTLRVASSGRPVYVEKPMARTAAECRSMVEACGRAGVQLHVAYYRRALPRTQLLETMLAEGAVGRLLTVNVRLSRPSPVEVPGRPPWRLQPEQSGGGLFVDLASHTLDLLDHLLGPVVEVSGRTRSMPGLPGVEESVVAELEFASGALGSGAWSFCSDVAVDEVEVCGTAGVLRFGCFDESSIRLSTASGDRLVEAPPSPRTVQLPLVQRVVDSLSGRGTSPSTGLSALRTAVVVDAVLGRS